MKFKLTFTGSHEALFRVLSKLLPDDLDVEVEALDSPAPTQAERLTKILGISKRESVLIKDRTGKTYYRQSKGPNLKKGINGIVMRTLADSMGHHTGELIKLIKHAGYSGSSLQSRLAELRTHGVIEQIGEGSLRAWRLREEKNGQLDTRVSQLADDEKSLP